MGEGRMSYGQLFGEAATIAAGSTIVIQLDGSADKCVAGELRRMMNEGQFAQDMGTYAVLYDVERLGWDQRPLRNFNLKATERFDPRDFRDNVLEYIANMDVVAA